MSRPSVQPTLFDDIPGLKYYPSFCHPARQAELMDFIREFEPSSWIAELRRRILCFGYRYDFVTRSICGSLGPLPDILKKLATDLVEVGAMTTVADQAIINEYLPGQGISRHIDARCFGPEIASISLGSTSVMRFRGGNEARCLDLPLHRGSVLVLTGAARYSITHGIPGRMKDVVNGIVYPRHVRFSITLRTVLSASAVL